jgi:hypothetical protein
MVVEDSGCDKLGRSRCFMTAVNALPRVGGEIGALDF